MKFQFEFIYLKLLLVLTIESPNGLEYNLIRVAEVCGLLISNYRHPTKSDIL